MSIRESFYKDHHIEIDYGEMQPMSTGDRYFAKVIAIRRQGVIVSGWPYGEHWGQTRDEAVREAEASVHPWIDAQSAS